MKIQSLQVLRAIAAWAVVYHHYMQLFYGFQSDGFLGLLFSIRGSLGVDMFFVLSGFIMFMTSTRASIDGWSFFLKRLFRVFPAYWFFTLILILFCLLMPNEFKFTDYTMGTLFSSLFFIPNENPSGIGVYPLLTVGWTLNYEVLFYTTLALCMFISKRRSVYLCAILLLAFPLLFIQASSVTLSVIKNPLMLQFLLGMSVGWFYLKFNPEGVKYKVVGGIMLLMSLIVISGVLGYGLMQKTIAATMVVTGFLLLNDLFNEDNKLVRFAVRLGDYSYSTYLSHVLVIGLYLYLFGNELNFLSEVAVLCAITITIHIVSSYSYQLVENSQTIINIRNVLINLKIKVKKQAVTDV